VTQDKGQNALADRPEAYDENVVLKNNVSFWCWHNNSPDSLQTKKQTDKEGSDSENSRTNPKVDPNDYFTTFN
jgi:hypothetical protein